MLAVSFPSLTSHYSSPIPKADSSTEDPSKWSDRLLQSLKEGSRVTDISEVLKSLLRHLSPSPVLPKSLEPSTPVKHFLNDETYISFLRAERQAGYPVDAYEQIFSPGLRLGIVAYLEEIFEIWAAVVAMGDSNMMGGGRLPLFLGWWVWGLGVKGKIGTWQELYDGWREAGRKVEHIFYSWIR